jgi:hypothetical protein
MSDKPARKTYSRPEAQRLGTVQEMTAKGNGMNDAVYQDLLSVGP